MQKLTTILALILAFAMVSDAQVPIRSSNGTFARAVVVGSSGVSETLNGPAAGHRLVSRPDDTTLQKDFSIFATTGDSITFRIQPEYTMLMANFQAVPIYLSAPATVLFNAQGNKIHLTSDEDGGNTLQLCGDLDSSCNSNDQTLKAFDKDDAAGTDLTGGNLIIKSGLGSGAGAPSAVTIATPDATTTGTTDQTYSNKFKVSNAIEFVATGGTKPTCNASNRHKIWTTSGGAGVADTFEVCNKNAADAYAWRTLF